MPNEEAKTTVREWVLWGLVLVLVQFIVHASAFVYSGSGNALNYWSIVGTSISIILALVAIFWSFIQNMLQQKGSASIATQLERLQSIVVEANKSGVEFTGQLQRLEEVRSKLEETSSLTRQSRADIAAMGKQVETTHKLIEHLAQQPSVQTAGHSPAAGSKAMLENFLSLGSLNGALLLYVCYLSKTHSIDFQLKVVCEAVQYLDIKYAKGYLVASACAGIVQYRETTAKDGEAEIENIHVLSFSDVVAKDIRDKLFAKIEGFAISSPKLHKSTLEELKVLEAMFIK